MEQNGLTIITRIKPEEVKALGEVLDKIGKNTTQNAYVSFPSLTSLQFACWVIVDNDPQFSPTLVMETNYDGSLEAHLEEWTTTGAAAVDAVYSKCEGYPATNIRNREMVTQYLQANTVENAAFYVGCPGQTLDSVRNAVAVRKAIQNFLDEEELRQPLDTLTAVQVHTKIKEFLATRSPVKPIISPVTLDAQSFRQKLNVVLLALVALPILLLLLPLILLYLVFLRENEERDARTPNPPPLPVDPRLFTVEDLFTQNHLTTLVTVKPGKFRLNTLKFILMVVNLLAKAVFITGNLGGIPTIHFARWAMMDDDRRLMFFSNYDGSWASYLGDFVDKANYGLTSIWSNTDSFPPANYLFFGGALHIEAFKEWSREHNLYAAVWYSAYPEETLWNLQKDVRLRDNIGKKLDEATAAKLLQYL